MLRLKASEEERVMDFCRPELERESEMEWVKELEYWVRTVVLGVACQIYPTEVVFCLDRAAWAEFGSWAEKVKSAERVDFPVIFPE